RRPHRPGTAPRRRLDLRRPRRDHVRGQPAALDRRRTGHRALPPPPGRRPGRRRAGRDRPRGRRRHRRGPRGRVPAILRGRELAGYDTFATTANRPAIELADRVSALAPVAGSAVFFTSGGSDAIDTAGKLALRYWHALGRPGKRTIVHRERSYHGMNAYGTSLAGIPANREGVGALVPDTASVGTDDVAALERLFAE